MHKLFTSLLILVAATAPMAVRAQTSAPRLQAYDHCIRLQVERQVVGIRGFVSEAVRDRVAQISLNACQAILPGAVADYKAMVISVTHGTRYEARAAGSSDNEWHEKVVTDRFNLAKVFLSAATAPPPPPDRSGTSY